MYGFTFLSYNYSLFFVSFWNKMRFWCAVGSGQRILVKYFTRKNTALATNHLWWVITLNGHNDIWMDSVSISTLERGYLFSTKVAVSILIFGKQSLFAATNGKTNLHFRLVKGPYTYPSLPMFVFCSRGRSQESSRNILNYIWPFLPWTWYFHQFDNPATPFNNFTWIIWWLVA